MNNTADILTYLTKQHFEQVETGDCDYGPFSALEKDMGKKAKAKQNILRVVHFPDDERFKVIMFTHNYITEWDIDLHTSVPTPVAIAMLDAAIKSL